MRSNPRRLFSFHASSNAGHYQSTRASKKFLLSGSIKSDVKFFCEIWGLRMCHPWNLVAFCENCFRHNLKTEKPTFLAREFHKESTLIFRLLVKNCFFFCFLFFFEILTKTMLWPFFNEDERNIYGQQNCKNLPTLSTWTKNVYQGNVFSFFDWFLIFENFCQESLKIIIWPKF